MDEAAYSWRVFWNSARELLKPEIDTLLCIYFLCFFQDLKRFKSVLSHLQIK